MSGQRIDGVYHWQEYCIRDLIPPGISGGRILLHGCGDASERSCLQEFGFRVVALDILRSEGTDLIADAHRLPLQDVTFDVVLSMQVLEHLHSPWLGVREIARVLTPGGWLIGSVAFLKPYHRSYFHMTHQGVLRLMNACGLMVDVVLGAQSLAYSTYGILLPLGGRRLTRFVYGALDSLLGALRARLWSLRTGLDPDQPTDRFDAGVPLSFREFERLRFAPTVVFRARRITGSD